jgi:hypothetical protein
MQGQQRTKVKAEITAVFNNGMLAEVDGQKGFIRRRNISWSDPFIDPAIRYSQGDLVDAVVLGTDPKHENQLSLSIKHAVCDPWELFLPRYLEAKRRNENIVVEGTVTQVLPKLIFLQLSDKTDAVLYQRDLAGLPYYTSRPLSEIFKLGDYIRGVAVSVNKERETVEISIRKYMDIMAAENKEAPASLSTLADIFGDKMASVSWHLASDQSSSACNDDDSRPELLASGRRIGKVLIVDDNKNDARQLQLCLEKKGIEAVFCEYMDESSISCESILDYDAAFIDKNLGKNEEGHSGIAIAKSIIDQAWADENHPSG